MSDIKKKNKNKIIMVLVSILLTLTLISTCMVSNVFAKYTSSRNSTSRLSFEKFGVTVEVIADTNKLPEGAVVTQPDPDNPTNLEKAGVFSVTISNLQLVPGDSFYEALQFKVTGTPNVDTKLRFTCEIDDAYNTDFNLPASVTGLDPDVYPNAVLMPLLFTCKVGTSKTDVCGYWHNRSANYIEETIIRNTAKKLGAEYPTSDEAYDVENDGPSTDEKKKYFDENENFFFEDTFLKKDGAISGAITDFYMGFGFSLSGTRKVGKKYVTSDIASTWIAEQGKTISFTYTIRLEQIVPTTQQTQ